MNPKTASNKETLKPAEYLTPTFSPLERRFAKALEE